MRFPASLRELTDTHRCPRCFGELDSAIACTACGFPVADPRSTMVRDYSESAASALRSRGALINAIVDEQRAREARATADRPAAWPPVSAAGEPGSQPKPQEQPQPQPCATANPPVPAQPTPQHPAPAILPVAAALPVPTAPPAPHPGGQPLSGPPTRSVGTGRGLQILLLVLGVSLLAIAAAFFLIYAWFTFDLVWRSISTVAVTLVSIVGASWLRRAQLRAAAEGVAALASALVVLDTWAASALGLFGLGRVDAALYWGCALVVLALVFEGWSRLSALRFPAIAASLAIVPGIGLLVAGLVGLAGDGPSRFAIGATGATIGALAHLVWNRH
ncbi:MAG: hypothetical protein ACTH31_12175, partial [Pseudoclavibacter sp.]